MITVYTGAAFVILSLLDMIREPFELPNWSFKLVVVILAVGLIIAVILSWIYDIHPEGGMVKTEPADKIKPKERPGSSKGWKIASYISLVVIVGLIVLNIIPGTVKKEYLDNSIAILPFEDENPSGESQYILNNMMTSIVDKLSGIDQLKVQGRVSTDKYNKSNKSPEEIGHELEVSYLLKAWGNLIGNYISLTVQLVVAQNGKIQWSDSYNEPFLIDDLEKLKNDIAIKVVNAVKVTITPEEEQRINKIPKVSLTAYDYYMKAEDYLWDYKKGVGDTALLSQAERLYLVTAQQDPTFAKAYTGLAKVYWEKNFPYMPFPNQDLIKKGREYLDKAFYLDDQLDEVYILRGKFLGVYGDTVNAIIQLDKALDLNPNSWEAYYSLGHLYFLKDQKKTLDNLFKANELYHGPLTGDLYKDISEQFAFAGFYDLSKEYWSRALELNNDTIGYLYLLARNENWRGNYLESISQCKEVLNLDSIYTKAIDRLAYNYLLLKEPDKAYPWYKKLENLDGGNYDIHRRAYVYSEVGEKEKANGLFNQMEQYLLQIIELSGTTAFFANYDLAGIYAYRGDKQNAYEYLNTFRQLPRPYEWIVTLIKNDPFFDSIRAEPEFQQIVLEVEAKYRAEHERISQWLKKIDML